MKRPRLNAGSIEKDLLFISHSFTFVANDRGDAPVLEAQRIAGESSLRLAVGAAGGAAWFVEFDGHMKIEENGRRTSFAMQSAQFSSGAIGRIFEKTVLFSVERLPE